MLEWHREEKPAQEEESVVELPAELCRILVAAGSRGVNTLLPLLHPNPILVSGPWQHEKGGHQGLGPHSRHVFAASSPLSRCYSAKDGASCRGGEERDKLVITGESLAWQSHSLAGMCVKSHQSQAHPGVHFKGGTPGRAGSTHCTSRLSQNLIRGWREAWKASKCQLGWQK